jgi:hypothetical protein
VTRPPSNPAGTPAHEEVLDELGDDAIVAQQAAVHRLQPRAQVDMEARTIVVAEDAPEVDPSEVMETRQLPQYSETNDPTAVARRAAARAPTMVLRRVQSVPPPRRRNWLVIGIWVAAGVVAFGFGGVLAAITARGSDGPPQAAAPPEPAPPPRTTPPASTPPAAAVATAPKPATTTEPEAEAITASDLPVEPAPARPRLRPKAASTASPRPTASPPKTAPGKTEIPEGI